MPFNMPGNYVDLVGRQTGVNPDGSDYIDPENMDQLRELYLKNAQTEADQYNKTGVRTSMNPYLQMRQRDQQRQDTNAYRQTQNGFTERRLAQQDQRQNDTNERSAASLDFRREKQGDANSQFDRNYGLKQNAFQAKQAAADQQRRMKAEQALATARALGYDVGGGSGGQSGQSASMSPDVEQAMLELFAPKAVAKAPVKRKQAGIYMPNDQAYDPNGLLSSKDTSDGMHRLLAGDEVRAGEGDTFNYDPVYDHYPEAASGPGLSDTARELQLAGMTPDQAKNRFRTKFGMGADDRQQGAQVAGAQSKQDQRDATTAYLGLVQNGYSPEDALKMTQMYFPGANTDALNGFDPHVRDPRAEALKKQQDQMSAQQNARDMAAGTAGMELQDRLAKDPQNRNYHIRDVLHKWNQQAKNWGGQPLTEADLDAPEQNTLLDTVKQSFMELGDQRLTTEQAAQAEGRLIEQARQAGANPAHIEEARRAFWQMAKPHMAFDPKQYDQHMHGNEFEGDISGTGTQPWSLERAAQVMSSPVVQLPAQAMVAGPAIRGAGMVAGRAGGALARLFGMGAKVAPAGEAAAANLVRARAAGMGSSMPAAAEGLGAGEATQFVPPPSAGVPAGSYAKLRGSSESLLGTNPVSQSSVDNAFRSVVPQGGRLRGSADSLLGLGEDALASDTMPIPSGYSPYPQFPPPIQPRLLSFGGN